MGSALRALLTDVGASCDDPRYQAGLLRLPARYEASRARSIRVFGILKAAGRQELCGQCEMLCKLLQLLLLTTAISRGSSVLAAGHSQPLATMVGVHYFGGWYPGPFSHWMAPPLPSTCSWLPRFPQRTPLLGLHTTNRTTVKAELVAAAVGETVILLRLQVSVPIETAVD